MVTIDSSYTSSIAPTSAVHRANEALATGSRINSASDDAAGLAIAVELTSQSEGLNQGTRNLNDGISLAQVADSSLEEGTELVQRLRELALQATNGINSDSNRSAIQTEFGQLQQQFSDLVQNTTFNGNNLLSQNSTVAIQAGGAEGDTINLQTADLNDQLNTAGFFALDVSTQGGAANALSVLDESLGLISETRSTFGATQNRLESRVESVQIQNVNAVEARSRIADTDYAQVTAERARDQILESAGIAMQSHNNASRQDALQLLGI